MRRMRAVPAGLVLLGLLSPWAHIVAVSAHPASPVEGESSHHAAELGDAFHGHHHPEGETEHRHSLVAFDLVALRARTIERVAAPASMELMASAWAPLRCDAHNRGQKPADSGCGPPGVSFQKAILRV